jgi:hypothetical protein
MITAPREQLQKQADRTRSRLLSTVDELDRRRGEWASVMDRAKRAAIPVAVGAGILVLAAAGAFVWGLSRLRRPVSRFARMAGLVSAFRTAKQPQRSSYAMQIAGKALLSALSFALTMVGRRIASQALPRLGNEHHEEEAYAAQQSALVHPAESASHEVVRS